MWQHGAAVVPMGLFDLVDVQYVDHSSLLPSRRIAIPSFSQEELFL
jgi:hypothetical protein